MLSAIPAAAASAPTCSLSLPSFQITYSPTMPPPIEAIGMLRVDCVTSSAVTVTVKLSPGISHDFAHRYLLGPHDRLAYALEDPLTGLTFGDGTAGTEYFSRTLVPGVQGTASAEQRLRLRIQPNQFVESGPYGDNALVATLEFY